MDAWKQTLALASNARTLERARASLEHEVEYKLGKGGYDPAAPLTSQCDCSGFVAWCIGVPRELPPRSNKWLQTDTFWAGGPPVGPDLFVSVPVTDAQAGDLIVYPDAGGSQGHMGVISEVAQGGVTQVIHCSSSNWKNHGDAIGETPPRSGPTRTSARGGCASTRTSCADSSACSLQRPPAVATPPHRSFTRCSRMIRRCSKSQQVIWFLRPPAG